MMEAAIAMTVLHEVAHHITNLLRINLTPQAA
jgi:hypothetical protein